MLDLTLLEERQVFGAKQLDILTKYGRKCGITDFSILLTGRGSGYSDSYTNEGNLTGEWWTKTPDIDGNVYTVHERGYSSSDSGFMRQVGIRPVFKYSSLESSVFQIVENKNDIKEITYGEYPQWIVDEDFSKELEESFNKCNLKTTGKSYTTDSVYVWDDDNNYSSFNPRNYVEYEYNGDKYIRFVGDSNGEGEHLSDNRIIEIGVPYWIKVEPIVWLVDEKADIALSKYIIVAGIQFDNKEIYEGNFEETFIKQFMNTYLAKEIECSVVDKLIENKQQLDIDSIFDDAINKMNEINKVEKPKILSLK